MRWTPLELWRANWLALALWRVSRGYAHWHVVRADGGYRHRGGTSLSSARLEVPAFLPVHVPALDGAGIPDHEIRLWRESYVAHVRGLGLGERMALEAYLGKGRVSRLVYWHAPSRSFRLAHPEDVVGAFVRVAKLAEVLDQPHDSS